jgi:hypothetical protein
MGSWEYRKSRDEGELGALGREGWELVAVLRGTVEGEVVFYFKRPGPDFREEVTMDQKRHYYGLLGVQAGVHDDGGEP